MEYSVAVVDAPCNEFGIYKLFREEHSALHHLSFLWKYYILVLLGILERGDGIPCIQRAGILQDQCSEVSFPVFEKCFFSHKLRTDSDHLLPVLYF